MKLRQLTSAEIEKLASRKGVKRIAVENFLSSMGDDEMYAGMNVSQDAHSYGWNYATIGAIRDGIRMAATRGGKMKIGDMTTEEIKKEMRVLNERSVKEYTWLHKNPRWMGLLNEYERRVMAKHIGGAKCGKGWHGQRIRHKLAALKRGHKFGGYKIDVPIKLGKSYRYDDEFEGKRLVDIVKVIETPIEIESKVIVYSPTLRANILLDKGKLKRR